MRQELQVLRWTAEQLRGGTVLVPVGWELIGGQINADGSVQAIAVREVPKGAAAPQSRSVARAERRES
jgi:hypothetical protein